MYIVHGASCWLEIYRIMPWSASDHSQETFGVRSGAERTDQGNDFELIPTIKMQTRNPVEIYFGRDLTAICYHCGVLATWNRQKLKIFDIFAFFLEKRPIMIKFSKFCSESLRRDIWSTLLCAKFVKIVRREIGEIVRWLPEQKINTISAPSQTVVTARITPKVCHGQPPIFGSQNSKFHPNRFTFGGVIAGRVKAVLCALWVNPILAKAIHRFGRIIITFSACNCEFGSAQEENADAAIIRD